MAGGVLVIMLRYIYGLSCSHVNYRQPWKEVCGCMAGRVTDTVTCQAALCHGSCDKSSHGEQYGKHGEYGQAA